MVGGSGNLNLSIYSEHVFWSEVMLKAWPQRSDFKFDVNCDNRIHGYWGCSALGLKIGKGAFGSACAHVFKACLDKLLSLDYDHWISKPSIRLQL